ncbi:MAG: cytochrome-c oxidase, cbb3-type subunit III [Caulobacteraceae bacterium]|nr:cytochrome-c oxidase, cbb3-type subunit III [Caulobacteraceae bacterium]
MSDKQKHSDEHTGVDTTGHVWDGIRELDNPLPRWWLWVFYATIAFAAVYWVLMPAWPGISSYTHGVRNHSDRAAVQQELARLKAARRADAARLTSASLEQIERDPALQAYALAAGASTFGDNCATCHGAGGAGGKGYPNLRDDAWLWGHGTLEDIEHTIRVGIRSDHPQTRQSQMPAFGRDGLLNGNQIVDLTQYVVALSGRQANRGSVARAAPLFAEQCASCHGAAGKGNPDLGAPDLTDGDWLYGSSPDAISSQIANGRGGVMPTWEGRLDDETIKAMAVYIHANSDGR